MKTLIWIIAVAVGLGLYASVGEMLRDAATRGACERHAAGAGLELVEWDGPAYISHRIPGKCTFRHPLARGAVRIKDDEIDRGVSYHLLVVLGSIVSVVGIAGTLLIGNVVTGALD